MRFVLYAILTCALVFAYSMDRRTKVSLEILYYHVMSMLAIKKEHGICTCLRFTHLHIFGANLKSILSSFISAGIKGTLRPAWLSDTARDR